MRDGTCLAAFWVQHVVSFVEGPLEGRPCKRGWANAVSQQHSSRPAGSCWCIRLPGGREAPVVCCACVSELVRTLVCQPGAAMGCSGQRIAAQLKKGRISTGSSAWHVDGLTGGCWVRHDCQRCVHCLDECSTAQRVVLCCAWQHLVLGHGLCIDAVMSDITHRFASCMCGALARHGSCSSGAVWIANENGCAGCSVCECWVHGTMHAVCYAVHGCCLADGTKCLVAGMAVVFTVHSQRMSQGNWVQGRNWLQGVCIAVAQA